MYLNFRNNLSDLAILSKLSLQRVSRYIERRYKNDWLYHVSDSDEGWYYKKMKYM